MCSSLQIAYTEEYEQQRGKGSFPAMITPAYQLAKKAQAHASDVSSVPAEQVCSSPVCSVAQSGIVGRFIEV